MTYSARDLLQVRCSCTAPRFWCDISKIFECCFLFFYWDQKVCHTLPNVDFCFLSQPVGYVVSGWRKAGETFFGVRCNETTYYLWISGITCYSWFCRRKRVFFLRNLRFQEVDAISHNNLESLETLHYMMTQKQYQVSDFQVRLRVDVCLRGGLFG